MLQKAALTRLIAAVYNCPRRHQGSACCYRQRNDANGTVDADAEGVVCSALRVPVHGRKAKQEEQFAAPEKDCSAHEG